MKSGGAGFIIIISFTVAKTFNIYSFEKDPPLMMEESERRYIGEVRRNIEILCPIYCHSKSCFFEWSKGKETIINWEGYTPITLPNKTHYLEIRSLRPENSGIYECKSVNGYGSISAQITLIVQGEDTLASNLIKRSPHLNGSQPEILTDNLPNGEVSIETGKNFNLVCEAKGVPAPSITWLKNEKPIVFGSSLMLTNATESQSGLYICRAENAFGKAYYSVNIKISKKPWIESPSAHIISLTPQYLNIFPSKNGSLTCLIRSESHIPPHVYWLKMIKNEEIEPNRLQNITNIYGKPFRVLHQAKLLQKSASLFEAKLSFDSSIKVSEGTYTCLLVGSSLIEHYDAEVNYISDENDEDGSSHVHWTIFLTFAFILSLILIVTVSCRIYTCMTRNKSHSNRKISHVKTRGCETSFNYTPPQETVLNHGHRERVCSSHNCTCVYHQPLVHNHHHFRNGNQII